MLAIVAFVGNPLHENVGCVVKHSGAHERLTVTPPGRKRLAGFFSLHSTTQMHCANWEDWQAESNVISVDSDESGD